MKERYKEALEFLFSQLPMFSRTGAPAYKPGLDTSIELSKYFDDPHKKFKSIHVGGTNGKGSTSHMIASVLQSQGYKVGLYTSPHLVDFRERMRINGKMIPEEKVVKFVDDWRNSGYDGKPSFFELTMIMAFNWFAEEKVDYAVIEVGMGGRLDSTNIITPLLSVITNISHDHNQFLGNTLQEIASEKAGIIKKGVPVVIGETQEETENVFREKAKEVGTEIVFGDKFQVTSSENQDPFEGIRMPLGGDYQKKNLRTVLTSLQQLRKLGIEIGDNAIKEGIEKVCEQTGLMGRWMVISDKGLNEGDKGPMVIADTGHNIGGLTYNFRQLYRLTNDGDHNKLRVVIGFVADKAIDKILDLLPRDAAYYITNAQIPRALPADKLWLKFTEKGIPGKIYSNVGEAYKEAKREASEKDIIFIGGSTFIVADFLHYLSLCDGRDS
ncbi:MAG: bifunctional folylpolyglutamate synthase/dihydrofolate synthase [Muribaculaceae bacterium]|nr:bifunctional folylpolyglutamate synthase/dihydrofolate synthase [Muribaculaceae bacterium]